MPKIIIVSNRLPISVKKTDGKLEFFPSVGGLATGLASYASDGDSKWIGWPGIASDDLTPSDKRVISQELAKSHCYPVFLTRTQLNDFYNIFSNSVLWPLFHDLPVEAANYQRYWNAYRKVNELFKQAVLHHSRPGSTVWVHDYQLLVLPQLLREGRPKDKIGFFLHIPFPRAAQISHLPFASQLIEGMLGADLLGFHTRSYVQDFLEVVPLVDDTLVSASTIYLKGRTVHVDDFPMGIDYEKYAIAQKSYSIQTEVRRLRSHYGRRKIILTVDRLDPTKGLLERLQAYKLLLASQPKLHDKVVLVMLAVPSRTEIVAYQALKHQVEAVVIDINATYGSEHWKPVDYMYTSLPFDQLTALYQIADVAFITPIRDGMNLVAKEYLASKRGANGVLILSETAGAAEELTDALLVDPRRRPSMAEALYNALTMPKADLKKRLASMQQHLATHTVQLWANTFMKRLQAPRRLTQPFGRLSLDKLTHAYQSAMQRQIFLDYDGVLTPFASTPEKAKPTKKVLQLLHSLISDPRNHLVIISGRKKQDLQDWFGRLDATLVAEHGMAVHQPGNTWQSFHEDSAEWKSLLKDVLEDYALLTPGAFVEEKDSALVWHYRMSPPYPAQKNLVLLKRALRPLLKGTQLKMYNGNKILEIKPISANKGVAAKKLLSKKADFILAIGDDYTDEDMFKSLPPETYTIKVGPGQTSARYRLSSPAKVLELLEALT